MKIEIDLDDIFRDEDGNPEESLQDSIRRQVIEKLSGDLRKRMFARLDEEISKSLSELVSSTVKERAPALVEDILNVEYTPVDRYGSRSTPTTFRAEIIKATTEQIRYQPKQYSSEENTFTKAVRSVVDAQIAEVTKTLKSHIDDRFKAEAVAFATKAIQERLGLGK